MSICKAEKVFSGRELFDIYRAREIAGDDWDDHVDEEICSKYDQLSEPSRIKFDRIMSKSVEDNKGKFANLPEETNTKEQFDEHQEILNNIAYNVVVDLDDFYKE